jgi:hypothetical protein
MKWTIMPRSGQVSLSIVAVAAALWITAAAHAQRLITTDTGWNVPAPFQTTTDSGDSDWNVAFNTTGGALIQRSDGFAREDRDAANTPDWVRVRFSSDWTRTFTISGNAGFNADVVVPILFDGTVNFGGPNPNISSVRDISLNLYLEREATPNGNDWGFVDSYFFTPADMNAAGGNQNVSRTQLHHFDNLAGGGRRYRLSAWTELDVTAQGAIPGVPGTGAAGSRVDFAFSAPATDFGAVYSLSAEPHNYNGDSRTAVRAIEARNIFGVTGKDARVGIVEVGQVSNRHTDLPAARLTLLAGAGVERYDNDEHATAVAGIIGSGSLDSSEAGVAPGATMTAVSSIDQGGFLPAATAIRNNWGAGVPGVINFSASGGGFTREQLDNFLVANQNITWVSSSGNNAIGNPPPNVPQPNQAYDIISVGALESNFNRPTDFSSTTGTGSFPMKPDIVAPGEYILATSVRDLNEGGLVNDYSRSFVGATWGRSRNVTDPISPDTGRVAGTSFSAPHATGVVALMHELSDKKGFDNRSKDQRVMKAVLLAGAETGGGLVSRGPNADGSGGVAWHQGTPSGNPNDINNPLIVTQPLDDQLGAGKLSALRALDVYSGGEARQADDNAARNFTIDLRGPGSTIPATRTTFWDLENVGANAGAVGTVDYFLGGSLAVIDNIPQFVTPPMRYLRTALTWDRGVTGGAYDPLSDLDLRLYVDGYNDGNVPGFDSRPGHENDDFLLAASNSLSNNVELLDLSLNFLIPLDNAVLPAGYSPNFYLDVRNFSGVQVTYGLAVTLSATPVPEPAALSMLALFGLVFLHPKRGRSNN